MEFSTSKYIFLLSLFSGIEKLQIMNDIIGIKIEEKASDTESVLAQTFSLNVKKENAESLFNTDSIKIECKEETVLSDNAPGMGFQQKTTAAIKKFKCSKCFVTLTNKSDLKKHRQIVHGKIKLFKCKECGKCFTLRIKLIMHIEISSTVNH